VHANNLTLALYNHKFNLSQQTFFIWQSGGKYPRGASKETIKHAARPPGFIHSSAENTEVSTASFPKKTSKLIKNQRSTMSLPKIECSFEIPKPFK
jgi:hypothetical protein